jgi:anaerobic magnesium-protoporphyrin IX monomethyl ester cyclase
MATVIDRKAQKNHLIVIPRIVNKIGDWYQFPMGIAYISAAAKKAGFNIFTINLNDQKGDVANIISRAIERHSIYSIATGGLTGQYGAIREVLEAAKLIRNNIVTICGGGIITSSPEDAMVALEVCDYGVVGEGEIIYCELLDALSKGINNVFVVPGIVMKTDTGFAQTIGKVAAVDLSELPYPYVLI